MIHLVEEKDLRTLERRINGLELRLARLERARQTSLEFSRMVDDLLGRLSRLEDRVTQWGITE